MNKEIFHNVLQDLPEVPLALSQDQIDTVTIRIIDTLTKAVELSTPVAKLSPRSKPGWTDECIQAIKAERRARRHFKRCPTEENHIILQIARREKDKAIRKATKMEHRNRVSEVKDMKGLWSLHAWARKRNITRTTFTPDIRDAAGTPQRTVEGKTAALRDSFFPTPPPVDLKDLHNYQYTNPSWAPDIKTWEVEEAIRTTSPDSTRGGPTPKPRAPRGHTGTERATNPTIQPMPYGRILPCTLSKINYCSIKKTKERRLQGP